jgi:hypothetical protein
MKPVAKNWQTSLAGILTLLLTGLQIYHDPSAATNPQTIAQIAGGIGLIVAKDAGAQNSTETSKTPNPTETSPTKSDIIKS